MHARTQARTHARTRARMYVGIYVRNVCRNLCIYVCMSDVCMYACMHVCMDACMQACMLMNYEDITHAHGREGHIVCVDASRYTKAGQDCNCGQPANSGRLLWLLHASSYPHLPAHRAAN